MTKQDTKDHTDTEIVSYMWVVKFEEEIKPYQAVRICTSCSHYKVTTEILDAVEGWVQRERKRISCAP